MKNIIFLLAWLALMPAYASNLVITPTFEKSITKNSQAGLVKSAVDNAITLFETDVSAKSSVKVSIDFSLTKDPNDLGSSSLAPLDLPYKSYKAYLQALPDKSPFQSEAFASLPAGPDTGINNNASDVMLTAANLAAIGDTKDSKIAIADNSGYDGSISVNLANASGEADLQSTVEHEIDEVLGIGGWGSAIVEGALPADVGSMDLYRYSQPGVRSFSNDTNESAYFSIDGGYTEIVYFNQTNNTDGEDFGDWGSPDGGDSNNPPQVQDAAGGISDIYPNLGVNELIALNAVGWQLTPAGMDIADQFELPAPSAAGLMLCGLGLLWRWRGRT